MLEMKRQWPFMIIGNGMSYQWWSGWNPTRPGFNGPVNFNSKTNTKACSSCWLSARNRLPGKDLNYDCSKSVPPSDQTRDWIACLLLFCCGGWMVWNEHGKLWWMKCYSPQSGMQVENLIGGWTVGEHGVTIKSWMDTRSAHAAMTEHWCCWLQSVIS